MIDGYYDLDYCVNSVLADMGETSKRHYQKFLNYAVEAYRRLNLGNMVAPSIKTAKLDIDSNTKTAQLPDDYVDFLKVGYSCHGVIINLDYNDDLRFELSNDVFPDACDCQDQLNQCEDAALMGGSLAGDITAYPFFNTIWYYASYFHNGQVTAGYYGYGAGTFRNAYRINKEKWQIQFDSYIKADFVILEYTSNSLANGNAPIEETHIIAIKNYIQWRNCLNDPTKNRLEAQLWERMWKQEVRGIIARQSALTAHDWVACYRKTLVAVPKR